ncbi:fasciclin domain-containing protein [Methanosarcina sp. T3]|uniref:fasciclin domain-containing protein n=1 Tax=Methanosarcina sp. T3 TaxID=3439062 RepID=UPI003F871F59
MNKRGDEIIRKIKLFGTGLITVTLISLMLLTSGCSQQGTENETGRIENETGYIENETRHIENETETPTNRTEYRETERENLEEEVEGVPQEILNVVEKSDRNVMQTLADRNFTTFVELLNVAGLEPLLAEEGIYTVFAPTNEAFAELPENELPALENNTRALEKVLTYHVVSGKILMENNLENMTSVKTLEGEELPITVTANGVQVGGANITEADIVASNGVIHQIDKVLTPPQ